MKTHTFSVVVGDRSCNANCPWCVSNMTESNFSLPSQVNWLRFETACKIAQQARDGLLTVLLTGKGEPLMHPVLLERYLTKLRQNGLFPLIDLQTNGVLLDPRMGSNLVGKLPHWRDVGRLTLVCISIAHDDPAINNRAMKIVSPDYNYRRAISAIQDHGLAVRLNVTMTNSHIHTPDQCHRIIDLARSLNVEQLTFREVAAPSNRTSKTAPASAMVTRATAEKEEPHGASKDLFHYLELKGANRLPNLAHGASVFDFDGQNVSVSHCLTDTLDPNDIRQLIFFPNGEIAYDWKYKGARLL